MSVAENTGTGELNKFRKKLCGVIGCGHTPGPVPIMSLTALARPAVYRGYGMHGKFLCCEECKAKHTESHVIRWEKLTAFELKQQ